MCQCSSFLFETTKIYTGAPLQMEEMPSADKDRIKQSYVSITASHTAVLVTTKCEPLSRARPAFPLPLAGWWQNLSLNE